MVEAAGVEPEKPINANAVMAHDFRRFGPDSLLPFTTSHSSHIHFNLLESSPVVETFWRRGFWVPEPPPLSRKQTDERACQATCIANPESSGR